MKNEVTVSAKTVEDAVTEALIEMELTSDMIEYEVIEKGSAGFLGIGTKQAVIRAYKKAEAKKETSVESKKEERKEYKKDTKKEVKNETKEFQDKGKTEDKKEVKKEEKKDAPKAPKTEVKEAVAAVKTDAPVAQKDKAERAEIELAEVTAETKDICTGFLTNVLKAMDMEVNLEVYTDEEGALCIDMAGENMGLLIGKRGQTLDSLQYLTNRVANKSQDGYVRVKLDTEDYRRRRKETLENLAKNIAYKVKRTKRAVSLEPMNPYERRIIHSALQGEAQIATHSEGDEPFRRVVVTLARYR